MEHKELVGTVIVLTIILFVLGFILEGQDNEITRQRAIIDSLQTEIRLDSLEDNNLITIDCDGQPDEFGND